MKKLLFLGYLLSLFVFFNPSNIQAQAIASIGGQAISKQEFLYAFNKNRDKNAPIVIDSLELYLEQFINFKLKVNEARAQGYDQSEAFQDELAGYISQIRKPYLESSDTQKNLLIETYERMKEDINASHILIKVSPNAQPKDTLDAFNFLDSLRITVSSPEVFRSLAKKYSQDGSAEKGGELGWFTALQMVAPFEESAYQTPENSVSEVVRSQFGYHLIFVNDRRSNRGKIKTSHIFFTKQRGNEEALQRSQMVYDSLMSGADWNRMAELYSDDQGTREDGGELPWAKLKQLPDDFLEIAYSIENKGDFTEPKETSFGWHIIRLDDSMPLEPYKEKEKEIQEALKRMGRNSLQDEQVIEKLKKENDFQFGQIGIDSLIKTISEKSKNEINNGSLPSTRLFEHGNKTVTIADFLNTIPGANIKFSAQQLEQFYKRFEKEIIYNYEDLIAPQKYPDYGFLMQEYEEGLLLFEIMQEKVWNRAITDSVGLQNYYQEHLEKYRIGDRLNCIVVETLGNDQIETILTYKPGNLNLQDNVDSLENWLIAKDLEELKIAKSNVLANEFSNFEIGTGLGKWITLKDESKIYLPIEFIKAGIQPLNEIKGVVMADYQEMLDQEWINELRKSAKIRINKRVIREISTH